MMDMYLKEQLASRVANQLQLSSACQVNCVFCCNKQGPFPTLREPYRSMESVKKGIDLLIDDDKRPIGLRMFRRLSEGEALLHPKLFQILDMIREKFPDHIIEAETNGLRLTEKFVNRLEKYKPLSICLSYHSHNPENWAKIFRIPPIKHHIPRDSFPLLIDRGIEVLPTVSPVPNLVGWQDIEETVEYISRWVDSMDMSCSCYTDNESEEVKELLKIDYEDLARRVLIWGKKYNIDIYQDPDLLAPLDFYPKEVMVKTIKKHKNVVWLLSECAYERAKVIIQEHNEDMPNNHYAKLAKCLTYGGNVIISGALTVNDFRVAMREVYEEGIEADLFMVPAVAFDINEEDLAGETVDDLRKEFDVDVWVITDQHDYSGRRIENMSPTERRHILQTFTN